MVAFGMVQDLWRILRKENTMTVTDSLIPKPIKVAYDPGSPDGDDLGLAFYQDGKCIGQLCGVAARYVYSALHQLDALLEEKRGEDND